MTTTFSPFMLNQIAQNAFSFAGRQMGMVLLYSSASINTNAPNDLIGFVAQQGQQEVSTAASPTYKNTSLGALVSQAVSASTAGNTVTVGYGSAWQPIPPDPVNNTAKPVYVAAGLWYIDSPTPVAGVLRPWVFATTDPFGSVLNPNVQISGSPRQLFSYYIQGTGAAAVTVPVPGPIVQAPGSLLWESPRVQHVHMLPQRVNWVPNPSFEDVGLFGWRSDGAMTRTVGGVDNPANFYVHTAGTRLQSIPVPRMPLFRLSAWVRGSGNVTFHAIGLDNTYYPSFDQAGQTRPLPATWTRYDELFEIADDAVAVIPQIQATGPFDCDLVLFEATPRLNLYYDGNTSNGITGDFSWQNTAHQSYSFWYNNRFQTAARLFGEYLLDGQVKKVPGLVYDWVPTGTTIMTHWDVLSNEDSRHPLEDWGTRLYTP